MINYTTLCGKLKEEILKFSKKLCAGLSLPEVKFISNVLFGLLCAQSILLTDIARSLCESITLKKTHERLSRNLTNFSSQKELIRNYNETVKAFFDDATIYCCDPGDIAKKYSRKQELLGKVWDASENKSVNGYKLVEIVALTHETKLPVPVYTELFSSKGDDVDTLTTEILKSFRHKIDNFGNGGIITGDRGLDCVDIFELCHKKEQKFIIRGKKNRNVIHNGETLNILDLANRFKGKITLKHTDKYGKNHNLKMWHIPIELPELAGVPLTLLAVHGYDKKDPEPMLLITNCDAAGKQKSLHILKAYLCRWRIEEYYRFKKNNSIWKIFV